jgi:hypothetical protein
MADGSGVAMLIWSTLLGGAGGVIGAFGKDWVERRNRLDESLRAKRADLYMKLWQLSGILPRWPRAKKVTYRVLEERSGQLRDWYYEEGGGIYLSEASRKAYGAAQEAINEVVDAKGARTEQVVSDADYKRVMEACSRLQTRLSGDLHSRREAARMV